ncbi:MAG: serine hydrolase, partial [Clostridia bacterium]|nr:serine hydrolase [Clostridia bacterium]
MIDMKGLRAFKDSIWQAVEAEQIPGAVMLAGRNGETLLHEACGYAQLLPTREPMTKDTLFDIASLSKMTGTWPGIMKLLQDGTYTLHS